MKHVIKTVFITAILIFLSACSQNSDDNLPDNPDVVMDGIEGDEGTFIEIFQGATKIKTIKGTSVITGSGQLLNGAYFRQFNIANDMSTLHLRFSLGKEITNADVAIYKSEAHDLREIELLLQDTSNLTGVTAEMYMPNSTIYKGNSFGTIRMEKDKVAGNGIQYKVLGRFEATFRDVTNAKFTFKGLFWKKEI